MSERAVFDCMVYLQATARKTGPAAACLRLALEGRLELCVSTPILDEVQDVLSRDKLRRKFPALTDEAVASMVRDIMAAATSLDPVPEDFKLERDPKDEKYLNAAIAGGAAYLVSRDNVLLGLMKDDAFRKKHPNLTILDPVDFLRKIDPRPPKEQAEGGAANPEADSKSILYSIFKVFFHSDKTPVQVLGFSSQRLSQFRVQFGPPYTKVIRRHLLGHPRGKRGLRLRGWLTAGRVARQ